MGAASSNQNSQTCLFEHGGNHELDLLKASTSPVVAVLSKSQPRSGGPIFGLLKSKAKQKNPPTYDMVGSLLHVDQFKVSQLVNLNSRVLTEEGQRVRRGAEMNEEMFIAKLRFLNLHESSKIKVLWIIKADLDPSPWVDGWEERVGVFALGNPTWIHLFDALIAFGEQAKKAKALLEKDAPHLLTRSASSSAAAVAAALSPKKDPTIGGVAGREEEDEGKDQ